MWLHVGVSLGVIVLAGSIAAAVFLRRGSSQKWIDVGAVSGGWLVEHRCDTSQSSSV